VILLLSPEWIHPENQMTKAFNTHSSSFTRTTSQIPQHLLDIFPRTRTTLAQYNEFNDGYTRKPKKKKPKKKKNSSNNKYYSKQEAEVPSNGRDSAGGGGGDKRLMRTQLSINELEQTMNKRFGSDLPKSSFGSKKAGRRPVFDPWDDKQAKSKMRTLRPVDTTESQIVVVEDETEYYDVDDEGYEEYNMEDEINILMDNDVDATTRNGGNTARNSRGGSASKVKLGQNLVSPRPLGGQGNTPSPPPQPSNSNGGGGFFSRTGSSVQIVSEEIEHVGEFSSTPTDISAVDGSTKKKKKKKKDNKKTDIATVSKNATPVLLDENSKEVHLTLGFAKQQLYQALSAQKNAMDIEGVDEEEETFESVGIVDPVLLRNLESMGCSSTLAVQRLSCPPIISGNDLLISTHTGSGKTLAFLLPLVQRILFASSSVINDDDQDLGALFQEATDSGVKVLVVAPGRELASQIVAVARELLQDTGLGVSLAIGGTPFGRNVDQLRKKKPAIVVGTPGRIAELVVGRPGEKNARLKISSLTAIVLDEFDALLLSQTHADPTNGILEVVKKKRRKTMQSVLCSATALDIPTSRLNNYLRPGFSHAATGESDLSVSLKGRASLSTVHGALHLAKKNLALDAVRRILHTEPYPQQVLVFVDNARRVGIVVDKLADMGIIAAPLHGGAGSEKGTRAEVSKALREGRVGIVVATEMAARGIDAPLLTHVINLDLPTDSSHYAHRAGRCGRGGRPGVVVNITCGGQERNVPKRFAADLGIKMHAVEAQGGKLKVVVEEINTNSITTSDDAVQER